MKFTTAIILTVLCAAAAFGQKGVVPFIDVKSGGLLGGFENGRFLDAKTTFGKLKGEQSYTLFGIKGKVGEATVTVEAPDEPCDEFYYGKIELDVKQGLAIGANRSWNPVPRPPRAIDLRDKTYLGVVSGILRAKGQPKARAVLEQAVKVDLDGDGTDEVILTASSYAGNIKPSAAPNDYSFVVVRKVVGGRARNIFLAEEYVKKAIEFGAPSRFEVSAIADLDGDGKMEIVVYGEYYEGSGASVYRINGAKAAEIKLLETGCGV
ncbi:MAG: VCBS repeat-containing protein [Acidobacteria bacterium]|nr:VCBS repeat-containing protein [Acidobacteriota bacterium]